MSDQTVQILVIGTFETEVPLADVIDCFIVNHERTIGVLERGMRGQDGVVRLHNRGGGLRRRVDAELQLDLLAVVDGQTLHEQSTETRPSSTTEGVEDEEALQPRAVVGDAAHLIQDLVDQFLANGVVATGVVVRGILLAGDHQLGVEEGPVGASADFVDDVGLEIGIDGAGDIFALACGTIECQLGGQRQI